MRKFCPISISLSPNTEKDDIFLAFKLIFMPWLWKKGIATSKLEAEFKNYLGVGHAISFNSGRSSLYAILKALNLPKESGVLLQAFTCNAVPNPILWTGYKPIYVDCDENDFNIDIKDLEQKIEKEKSSGNNPKILIVQHTFGLPALMDKITDICNKHNLILIEDCAHALGAEFDGKKVGAFGKAAFFSFSRDKVISSVYGGMATTNDNELADKIKKEQIDFGFPSAFWVFQQLLHPVLLNFVILPIYGFFDLGKMFLVFSQYAHILSKAVHWKEKRGQRPDYFPKALPNGLAILALLQFKKLDKFYSHRRKISEFYFNNLKDTDYEIFEELSPPYLDSIGGKHSYLRFAIKHKNAHNIIYKSWHNENILIGDWYTSPIAPRDTKMETVEYKIGECPKAENLSNITLNLPTHINISMDEADRIVKFLRNNK